ncbi:MAG: outer membrane beta-barrel protein [Candidatus Acidiferrales bacterium]|jgi:outer membrane protein OmpA-like peptidoglycan-associated protein/opacity protein-like surface antigen
MLLAMVAVLCMFATRAAAQDRPAPKWELYGGYSFFYPGADVHGQLPGALLPLSSRLEANPRGAGASVTYDFNRWLGLTLDTSAHWGSGEIGVANRIDDAAFYNLSLGPKITFRSKHFSPFLEVLVGDNRLTPDAFHRIDKLGFMFGGGLDINLSRHVALRLIRADYVMSSYRYAPPAVPTTDIRGLRAQVGLNFMFGGGAPPVPPSAVCSVQPTEVFAGEPETATAAGSNFSPKRTVKYSWNGTGVKVAGSEASTQIDTTGLQPGSYEVTANLSDGRKNGVASCSARFTVKVPRPPVISCAADPASVQTDGTSTIHSNASSPDGRRLTYSYSASAGEISGNGDTATLNTRGAQPGRITVTCSVGDDRIPPLTASSTTMVNVEAPPPPAPAPEIKQLEAKLALHSIYFQTARPTAENPEGGLVDSQAEILKTLAADFTNYLKYMPDAHLILGGHADPRGSEEYNKGLTQRRVDRTKNFLVQNGVPEDHIDTRSFGKEDQLTADQIKDLIAQNPDLNPADRQQMLNNLQVMVLANNRRVDVTLSTTGQESTRLYPFNAKDYLALISIKGGEKKPPLKKKPRR